MSGKTSKATGTAGAKVAEGELEKFRQMGEWKKVLEALEASRTGKTPPAVSSDVSFNFFTNEAKLELWLEEHQPTEKFIHKARTALSEFKKGLQHYCLTASGESVSESSWICL